MTSAPATVAARKDARFALILLAALLPGFNAAPSQQPAPAGASPSHSIKLDIAVDTKSGQPVPNLTQQDFTILDNKSPRPITSFKVVSGAKEQVEVIVFIDAVNTPFQMVSYVRQNVEKYFHLNESKLAYPTQIAVLTDDGVKVDDGFSTDGNALSDVLEHHEIGLREINRSSEWSGDERLQICLNAFHQLLQYSSKLPGRKIILWISPGWPLVSGPRVYLTGKESQQIFNTIVDFSTQMRQDNVTLYNINPVGVEESMNRTDYYQVFLKGAARPNDVQPGNLGLQVLAIQSGGLAIESNSDVTGNIQRCLADLQSWYQITFDPAPGDKPNEYHHIDVKTGQSNLVARTRDGYYANPQFIALH